MGNPIYSESQRWRFICLAFGVMLLMVAPVVSNWVPFYYSSLMAIGILLVVIILLFQGMKLLPTGRKSFFYLTIYVSLVGAGSFVLHHFSGLVNWILVNLCLSEEMHNPLYYFDSLGSLPAEITDPCNLKSLKVAVMPKFLFLEPSFRNNSREAIVLVVGYGALG